MPRRYGSLPALHSNMSPSTDPRNANLNAAFTPPWANGDELNRMTGTNAVSVPQGDTRFDPFMGTGWGEWLDKLGAKKPGGVNLSDRMSSPGGRLPTSPMELPSTAFTGEESNSPYGATPIENQLPSRHRNTRRDDAPMPSINALQSAMSPMQRQASDLYRKKYPGADNSNIVWGS